MKLHMLRILEPNKASQKMMSEAFGGNWGEGGILGWLVRIVMTGNLVSGGWEGEGH